MPLHQKRLEDRLAEGRGLARDQCQAHRVPIAAGDVLHHRPALHSRLSRAGADRRHDEPVGGFPQRRAGVDLHSIEMASLAVLEKRHLGQFAVDDGLGRDTQ